MKYPGLWIVALVFPVVVGCKSSSKSDSSGTWSGQMQSMSENVKALVPFVYDEKAFEDSANRAQILERLKYFAESSHKVNAQMGKPFLGDDLLIRYSLSNLQSDLNRAVRSFEEGQMDYSRAVVKGSMAHCFRCHSVTDVGARAAWNLDGVHALELAPIEKADLLVATRKYDEAFQYMEGQLNSKSFQKKHSLDYESFLRRYLALAVRIDKKPDRAFNELNKILAEGNIPSFVMTQAKGWKASLEKWAKEKNGEPKNSADLFNKVKGRFSQAEKVQRFAKDHAGDVEFLRATLMLHNGMPQMKSPKDQAQALFFLGKAYEVLDELGSWNLNESYYEACIQTAPKSTLAKSCYDRLEASLMMGYSGSSGVHLPPGERDRLKRLKEMTR